MNMDFLDPRRKKAHRRRLVFGYALMSIVIAIGTLILLNVSYGFDIDRKTGELIQNGIIFVDSKPQGSKIYLDDKLQPNTTNTRLDVPAGLYTLRLENEGYRNWQRSFSLDGGQFQRIIYPLLIPNVLETSDVQDYSALPQLSTQSPDRRWLLVQQPGQTYRFDLFDLNDQNQEFSVVQLPVSILTEPSATSTLEVIEWSNDNRHVVFKRTFGDKKTEFIIFDREKPNESINLNASLGINPAVVSLKNKRPDQLYFLDTIPGVLRIANTKDKNISAPLVGEVIDYRSYGDDLVLFVTKDQAEAGKADFRILDDSKVYNLKTVNESDKYVLDISKYDDEWYYLVGSSSDEIVFVYQNPLPTLQNQTKTPLIVEALLRIENPQFASFSANTQFIIAQSGNKFVTIDLEDRKQYYTTLDQKIPASQELKWMDGHRLLYVINNQSYIIDFDGSNGQTLVTSMGELPYFDRDYDNVFTLEGSKTDPVKQALTITIIDLEQ